MSESLYKYEINGDTNRGWFSRPSTIKGRFKTSKWPELQDGDRVDIVEYELVEKSRKIYKSINGELYEVDCGKD